MTLDRACGRERDVRERSKMEERSEGGRRAVGEGKDTKSGKEK